MDEAPLLDFLGSFAVMMHKSQQSYLEIELTRSKANRSNKVGVY